MAINTQQASNTTRQVLSSDITIQDYIDNAIADKVKYKQVKQGIVQFGEQFSNASGKSVLMRGFDLTQSLDENSKVNITRSPIENGDLRTVHISQPRHTIQITGIVSQISAEFISQQEAIEAEVRTELARAGRYAPALVGPVRKVLEKSLNRINKIKASAEGYLADARGFYKLTQRLQGKDTSIEMKAVVFKEGLATAQRQKILFTVNCGGTEYKDRVISDFSFSQDNTNHFNATFTITFEEIILVDSAIRVSDTVKNAVQKKINEYKEKEKKQSVGVTTALRYAEDKIKAS